ncbi:MAG: DNA-directed DNA polymerase [Chlorobiota bacterium]
MGNFVHLHNHTHYSLQDAACTVKGLVKAAADFDMHAVALTDHGVMYGIPEFYKAAKGSGLKPVLGMEAYITIENKSRFDKAPDFEPVTGNRKKVYHHLILLAKNNQGFKNLIKLSSRGFLEGYYYKPRIDLELLREYSEGLICTSACLGGIVSFYIRRRDYATAREVAKQYHEIFGDDFYLEIQDHKMPDDPLILEGVPRLAKELGIKLVATNDCHYIKKEDAIAHNILLKLSEKGGDEDYKKLRYGTDQIYFKSQEEMIDLFKKWPESIASTLEITDKCNVDLDKKEYFFPNFPIPDDSPDKTLDGYFEYLSRKRFDEIFPGEKSQELTERFEYELKTIKSMGFAGYFLIVQDFINAAKEMGVSVGPGRGSAAGSLIAFVLGITKINPLDYDLLFERFLNPARKSMPDIDVDFADEKRGEVIEYVKRKYGSESVSQIITFSTLASKAAIKDVGRVLNVPLSTVNHITKYIPSIFGKVYSIEKALAEVPELKNFQNTPDPKLAELFKYAKTLEGMNRNASKHAAGVVIAPGDVSDYVPLAVVDASTMEVVSQYNMKELEAAGLLKMDFLGLRTLSIIEDTLAMARQTRPQEEWVHDIDAIPLDDQLTYDIFADGKTTGIFQFESVPMRKHLKRLKPQSIKDLAAMNALYRPGPMENIDDFIDRKYGRQQITYLHPKLEPILKETYGIIVYQEQVIRIANQLAGMSLAEADILRRAMGKKDVEAMAKQRKIFVDAATAHEINEKIAGEVFDLIDKFANYGFNKSHAVAYSYLAYQTAYLKAHFTEEFLAANMTHEFGKQEKVTLFLEDCRKLGIKVLSPDVNRPAKFFTVENKMIRFGLSAIKNVGETAVDSITAARKKLGRDFRSVFEFASLVDLRLVNKRAMEGLVMAGAFDSINSNRRSIFEAIPEIIVFGQNVQEINDDSTESLFGEEALQETIIEPKLPVTEDWSLKERFAKELEVTGFYISNHPMSAYDIEDRAFSFTSNVENFETINDKQVGICGVINELESKIGNNGAAFATFTVNGLGGMFECTMWARAYERHISLMEEGAVLYLAGKAELNGDSVKILVESALPIEQCVAKFTKRLKITIDPAGLSVGALEQIVDLVSASPGNVELYFEYLQRENGKIFPRMFRSQSFRIGVTRSVIERLAIIVGEENLMVDR